MSRLDGRQSSSQEELCCLTLHTYGLPYPQAHTLCVFVCVRVDCFIIGILFPPIVLSVVCGQVTRWGYILCLLYSASGGGAIMEIKEIKHLRSSKPRRQKVCTHCNCCLRKAKQNMVQHTLKLSYFITLLFYF